MTTLRKQTISGVKWLVGSSFIQKAITFSATIILARILTPSVFGLFSLAFVAIDGLALFKSLGFDSALIRRKEDIEKAANTAFFVIPCLGICLYFVLSLSAPIIGVFFNNQELVSVVRALGIIFVISCFGKVPTALLEKNMQFKKVSIIEISSAVIYAVFAIVLAVLGFGIWSLIIAYILKTLSQNTLAWVFSGWHPRFEFDKETALEMFHFGKFLFLGSVVWFLKMNLDNVLVGKLLGTAALGLYAIAFSVANICADQFGNKIYRVVFPAYSRLQGEMESLKYATLKTLKYTSLIAVPIGVAFFLLSREFLLLMYGEKWLGATNALRILAFAGIFNTLPVSMGGAFLACGKAKLTFLITTLQVIIFVILIAPMAITFGINGVAIVVTFASFSAFVISLIWAMKLLRINIKQIYLSLITSLVASTFMVLVVEVLKYIYLSRVPEMSVSINFILSIVTAVFVYICAMHLFERTMFRDIKNIILGQ